MLLAAPATSFLVFPAIQGTTPAYILCFSSMLMVPVLMESEKFVLWLRLLLVSLFVWCIFFVFSQLGNLVEHESNLLSADIILVDPLDTRVVLRGSLFTQSLYLFAVVLFALLIYITEWKSQEKTLRWASLLMAGYGLYEFIYFFLFHESGDFISNRMFGSDLDASGSMTQSMVVGSLWIMRVKSLTGEPSMYALMMMPVWFYAKAAKWPLTERLVLGVSLLLTFSTTALLSYMVGSCVAIWRKGVPWRKIIVGLMVTGFIFLMNVEFFLDLIDQVVLAKALGENLSGAERSGTMLGTFQYWLDLNWISQLFGVGFGYVRSTDFISTLIVNCGLVGLFGFMWIFLKPFSMLSDEDIDIGLKQCLLSTMLAMLIAVSEFSYLIPWLFLVLSIKRIKGEF
ncbi:MULTISPECIES: hypothetical protein [unclassified Limnohabitans]|uniref:hypothetical protein n=1 Tax=unclassified Limnohabitans TaxID=2626134 RepID=UPI0011B21DF2|nr:MULTISPECIES: hypothetical protein [unclassified Limnohabitans]